MKRENIEKAQQTAAFITAELQAAHRDAIESGNGMAEIVLLGLIGEAAQLAEKINAASRAAWPSAYAVQLAGFVEELAAGHSIEAAAFGLETVEGARAAGII